MGWRRNKYDNSSVVSSDLSSYPAMPPPPPNNKNAEWPPRPFQDVPDSHELNIVSKEKKNRTWHYDSECENGGGRQDRRRRRRPCLICCAWSLLIMFVLALALLFMGLIFLSTLKLGLPEVRIVKMDIATLDVDDSKADTMLNATVHMQIQVSNKNDNVGLHFSTCKVSVSSQEVLLGQTNVASFAQKANETNVLKVNTEVRNSVVNEDDALEMEKNAKNDQMVANVLMSGTIGYRLGDHIRIDFIPFLVICEDIRVIDVSLKKPLCKGKIFSFRTSP